MMQEKDSGKSEEKPKISDDIKAARKAFSSLSKLMKKKDYMSASKLMTKDGFDEFCTSKIFEAGMMADQQFAPASMAEKVEDVLDKYNIDISDMPDMLAEEIPSIEEQRESNKKILAGFKDVKQRLAAVKELEAAMEPDDNDGTILVALSPFDGEIVGSSLDGEKINIEVKPTMPEGMEMMMVGPDGELPEGVEMFEAEELPPGAVPMEEVPMDEIPEGAEMADMMIGGIPNMHFRLKKEEGEWKWDGFDMEKMVAAAGGVGTGLEIPTIENPEFSGTALSGKEVSLKDYRGKLVLVDFWGTWCKPCVAELPKLKKLHDVLQAHGFEIVGVAMDNKKDLEKFTEKTELPWENIIDGDGEICDKYGIQAFPTTLLIDKEGKHVASNLHGQQLINELAGRLDLGAEAKDALTKLIKPKRKRAEKAQF